VPKSWQHGSERTATINGRVGHVPGMMRLGSRKVPPMANEDSSKSQESGVPPQLRPKTRILIGGFDFGDWCQRVRIENAVNRFPTAEIDLQLDATVGTQLDYLANVQVVVEFQKQQYPRVYGYD
jgi:hypothetical protein